MSLVCPSIIASLNTSLCAPVDIYCERTSAALDAEPVNAFSNIALLFAAWLAWREQSKRPVATSDGLVRVLIVMVAIVGFGSFLFHTVATRWAEWGDVIPIFIFIVLYLWLVLTRFFGWSAWHTLLGLSVFLASSFLLEALVPAGILSGGAMYLPTVIAVLATSIALHRSHSAAAGPMTAAAGIFFCALVARTLDMQVCGALPLGTHFLWHLLMALFLYLLMKLAIRYSQNGLKKPTSV